MRTVSAGACRGRGTIAAMTTDTTGTAARDGEPRRGGPADSPFLRACRREPVPHTPVWFMRQAGRSLPEYREIRADVPMLEACRRPDLVTEITLQPVRRHGVDAAILFSDIVVPLAAVGVDLDIVPGTGPVVAEPIRTAADLERLRAARAATTCRTWPRRSASSSPSWATPR